MLRSTTSPRCRPGRRSIERSVVVAGIGVTLAVLLGSAPVVEAQTTPKAPVTTAIASTADTTPIPLPAAIVAITDDPRVAPELANVGLTGDGYQKAVMAYQDTDRRRVAAVAAGTEAGQRFDRAVQDLVDLAIVIPRVEGELAVALRREAKAALLLEGSRSKLSTFAIDAYVTGGIGASQQDDLNLSGSNEVGERRVLMQVVQRHTLGQIVFFDRVRQDEARHIDETIARLDELRRRVAQAEAGRDQAASDRARAISEEERLGLELLQRRKGIADARLTSEIDGIDFPFVVLNAYVRAAKIMATERPACGIRWNTLAAIGKTETSHGTFGGSTVDAEGLVTKPIFGISLDGANGTALVPDTDQGEIDGDPNGDRATGPMQFIPGTWKRWARDANDDGKADPQNLYDSALTAAIYLCQRGPGLDADPGLRRAIFSYNADDNYVEIVLGRSHHYARYGFPKVT